MELDIKKYAAFIKRNEHLLKCYATLDVIPGKFGKPRTTAQVEHSASASHRNHQILKDAGLKPIPIFHQGESFKWLETMIKDLEPYIGISTAKDLTKHQHRRWLDDVFTLLTDTHGVPFVKTHGFGITAVDLMLRYPWYTTDSTTWALAAGYGIIYVPPYSSKGPDYSKPPTRVIMSGREQKGWSTTQRQFDTLGVLQQKVVLDYLKRIGDLPLVDVRYDSEARRTALLYFFDQFVKANQTKPFKHRHGPLSPLWCEPADELWEHMTIHFATSPKQRRFNKLMTDRGANTRLISYFDLLDLETADELLERYVMDGIDNIDFKYKVPTPVWDEYYSNYRRMALAKRMETKHGSTEAN